MDKPNEGFTYFLTLTVVDWVDIFTRPAYRHVIVNSLKYCHEAKGLEIFAWVLMSNHLHLVARATKEKITMSDILRDFKKFTSKKIVETLKNENESRKQWLLYRFEYNGKYNPKIENYKFWQDGSHEKECFSLDFTQQKIDYIHQNPVRAEIVEYPEEYLYSSARDYVGKKGLIPVTIL